MQQNDPNDSTDMERTKTMKGGGRVLRMIAWAIGVVVLGSGLTVMAPGAQADTGDLRHSDSDAMSQPTAVAVGPDGRVFVASRSGVSVSGGVSVLHQPLTIYARGPSGGSLGVSQCFGALSVGDKQCAPLPAVGDPRALDIVVSPDGLSVYLLTVSGTILHFRRGPETFSQYTFDVCYHNNRDTRPIHCGWSVGWDDPKSLAITNSGQHSLYVRSHDGVMEFDRRLADGRLDPGSCFVSAAAPRYNCRTLDVANTTSLEVAPGGDEVFLGAFSNTRHSILYALDREVTSGGLSYVSEGCLAQTGTGCVGGLGPAIGQISAIAFSPDGLNAYLTHYTDTVTTLERTSTGAAFSFDSCLADVDQQGRTVGCTFTTYIAQPGGIAVSNDGASVYVSGFTSDSVATFNRATGGSLTPDQCFVDADPADPRCVKTPGLDGASDIKVVPGGNSVHVAAEVDEVVTTFTRETSSMGALLPLPPVGTVDATPPVGTVDTTPPDTSLDSAVAGKGKSVTFTFSSPDTGATFECRLGDEAAPCASPLTRTLKGLKPGSYSFSVAAIDAAGNRDESPATLDFTLRRGRNWKRVFPDVPVRAS